MQSAREKMKVHRKEMGDDAHPSRAWSEKRRRKKNALKMRSTRMQSVCLCNDNNSLDKWPKWKMNHHERDDIHSCESFFITGKQFTLSRWNLMPVSSFSLLLRSHIHLLPFTPLWSLSIDTPSHSMINATVTCVLTWIRSEIDTSPFGFLDATETLEYKSELNPIICTCLWEKKEIEISRG